MNFDPEGHVMITPAEFESMAFDDRVNLINNIIIPGTPWCFETYADYGVFLQHVGDAIGVHPRNIGVLGSCKLNFSMTPRPEKLWGRMRPDSDIDLAVIDPVYYSYIDGRIRDWELGNPGYVHGNQSAHIHFANRQRTRGLYFLRWEDLPPILPSVNEFKDHIDGQASRDCRTECCGVLRPMKAYLYQDWKSVYRKCEEDLQELCRKIQSGELTHGGAVPLVI